MSGKKIIRRDHNLTQMACIIFGAEIIDSCYITAWDFGNSSEIEINDRLEEETYRLVKREIDIDSGRCAGRNLYDY